MSVKLSPPQFTLYRQLKGSIGNDPMLQVYQPFQVDGIWVIEIRVKDLPVASALAGILKLSYDFGGIAVRVVVFGPAGDPVVPLVLSESDDPVAVEFTRRLIATALRYNRCFVKTIDLRDKPPGVPWGDVGVVFRPWVIQFWNDNLGDPFGYVHFVAQDVFGDVMLNTFAGNVTITVTTAIAP